VESFIFSRLGEKAGLPELLNQFLAGLLILGEHSLLRIRQVINNCLQFFNTYRRIITFEQRAARQSKQAKSEEDG
jgi:hypothetical protein